MRVIIYTLERAWREGGSTCDCGDFLEVGRGAVEEGECYWLDIGDVISGWTQQVGGL